MAEFEALENILPLCAWCRNIEDGDGNWTTIQDYISNAAMVTHGICPDCKCKVSASKTARAQQQAT